MRIIYIGCVKSSYILLQQLLDINAAVVGIITKKKSDFNSDFKDISELGGKSSLPILYMDNKSEEDMVQFIKSLTPDIGFCFGWSQLINTNILKLFDKGMLGFHPAQLPYNKGRHPIIWALALGLKKTASSFFYLEEAADTGKIVSQELVTISYEDNAQTLYNKIMDKAKEQVIVLYYRIETGTLTGRKQENIGNAWRKRSKNDGIIDWRMSSEAIYNLVRALTHPYIGADFIYENQSYKVWQVSEVKTNQYKNIEPGKIIKVNADGSFDVKAYDNIIRVLDYSKDFSAKEEIYL